MKLSTLLIGASALLTASLLAGTASASYGPVKNPVSGQTYYEAICLDKNTHRLIYREVYTDESSAQISAMTCNDLMGGNGWYNQFTQR
ncbi:hypothetical protein ACSLBF_18420 (plasmid) [Pseudoalteromonas sp. T1lg65]|uniref:hypothetical protein n=1 Tax=Pseudoalteromonas sp. T1lg65 TaxID=2077101 RepID=UPI003F7A94C5